MNTNHVAALWRLKDAMDHSSAYCPRCDEGEWSPNAEVFEETGALMCDRCAEAMWEAA